MALKDFELFLKTHLESRKKEVPPMAQVLFGSMEYSLLNGGKRFRPQVAIHAAEALDVPANEVYPFAAAVEMIHSYSLIHDDLPCMDDDDERRGKPTNHKVFGEATALLAGDGLLTEAFYVLAKHYKKKPDVARELIFQLSVAAGPAGMIAGQILDLSALHGRNVTADDLKSVHGLKTGALIQMAAFGPAIIAQASEEKKNALYAYGEYLGLAFQLADDILDFDPSNPEKSGYPSVMGLEKTQKLLHEITEKGIAALRVFGPSAAKLEELVRYNEKREK